MFTIKYNRTTTHIDGFHPKDSKSGEFDYAENACGALTRYRFSTGETFESPLVALNAALKGTRKLCQTCKKAAEAMIAELNKGEGTMSEQTTEERPAELDVIEQIQANIERAASLAEAENVDGLKELGDETETLISSLPQRGRILVPGREKEATWAQVKKDFRGEWRQVAQPKPQAEPKAEVKKVTVGQVVERTWDQYEGVEELVNAGAALIGDGVKAHVKISHLAKDVAGLVFDMWTKLPNKEELPDLMGASDQAKKASGEMLRRAGNGFEDNFDNKQALKKLTRSVQDQRSDVRAEWLRSLDQEDAQGEERRAIVAKLLEDKPEETPASAWVADKYGASLMGTTERKRLEYQAKKEAKELEAAGGGEGGEGEGEGAGEAEETTPDERVTGIARKLITDISKAKVEDFEAATEETKETVREELEKAMKALKAMIAATL